MTEANSADGKRARGGLGNFFIVDQRLWKAVCNKSDINAAAWLLLMQGTGVNHRTTAWSVDSMKRYLAHRPFPRESGHRQTTFVGIHSSWREARSTEAPL